MSRPRILGIGNAIVDVFAEADDSFLDLMGIEKGIMQLVERERGEMLYAAMERRRQAPGGSVANTLAGLGALGLETAFIGRVRDDALGHFYAETMEAGGTRFANAPVTAGELPTSRSMIFVSPDGERSMNTYLGISAELGPDDVSDAVAGQAGLLYLEGYLYDKPKGKQAFERATELTHKGGGIAGIALSDPFCADRHRADFQRLVRELDFVIGNEHEWESLYQCRLDEALTRAAAECRLVVCTRSGADVVLIRGEERVVVPVRKVTPVDATGAGDLFAAGFLYGIATDRDLETAGRMGCVAAAEVISHFGARPEADLKALFAQAGLL
ncbi:adenosine kinase [Limimaricola hongkongensis]|uniref:Fructokinase n=1 Tax=Limimaricola hongkongensis DSM 17492 TaxID=1122180 RepID=A0A017H908_9RHOB|nr:adenosine kinase [Limimaricola hongkongensis]EYD70608.1 Fructokinase [Limimaricola hongkongensis DSM 17492]